MPTFVTENESKINASIAGVSLPQVQSWTTFEGGDPSASTSKLHPGNTIAAVAVPGPVERTDVTVTRPYTTDLHSIVQGGTLEGAGNSAMSASYTPTDANGNPNGLPITRTGIFKGLTYPKWDAASGKVGMLGFVMECDT